MPVGASQMPGHTYTAQCKAVTRLTTELSCKPVPSSLLPPSVLGSSPRASIPIPHTVPMSIARQSAVAARCQAGGARVVPAAALSRRSVAQ